MHTTLTRLAAGSFVSALVLTAGVTVGAGATPEAQTHRLVTGPGQDLVHRPQVLLGGAGGGGAGGGGGGGGGLNRTME